MNLQPQIRQSGQLRYPRGANRG